MKPTRFLPIILTGYWLMASPSIAQESVDFSRDILPILADHCFACHGPDEATREGGFRLDVRESTFGEADSGENPVVPGSPGDSEIIRRLRSVDESERMPPPDSKKQPSEAQIELVTNWIRNGAVWKEHWAFSPPNRPDLPGTGNSWVRNPIDRFVLAKLTSQGLAPAPEASKTMLVRRLYLDLTGLPPSPEQVDAFLNDGSPEAYQNLVNQLLDSPHYGEHMATFWLDAARFADTNGYQNDFRRSMWLWRDWVIRAYNENMPYDQFVIEQLAGDMLPQATVQQKVASGFNRNHRTNTEGGSINEEWLVENVVDRVETTSTVFLGLTMGCARCHDHKYDPISQREFYQFFSYFHNVEEQGVYTEKRGNAGPLVQVATPEHQEQIVALQMDVEAARLRVRQSETEHQRREPMSEWEARITAHKFDDAQDHVAGWLNHRAETRPESVVSALHEHRQAHPVAEDLPGPALHFQTGPNQHLVLGDTFGFDASKGFAVSAWVRPEKYGAIISRMDESSAYRGFDMLMMQDGRLNVHLIHQWPGNATKITTVEKIPPSSWTHVLVNVSAPGKASNIQVYVNGYLSEQTVDSDTLNGSTLTEHPVWLGLRAKTPPYAGKISAVRIWSQPISGEKVSAIYGETLQQMIVSTAQSRTDEQQIDILHHYRQSNREYRIAVKKLKHRIQDVEQLRKQLPSTMVMQERSPPRETFVLRRGMYDQPDKSQPVAAAVPSLFKSETTPANRLEFAEWLVNGDNPLTARVAVNHFWARYFGIGLLETPENFGLQSPPPSHPQLLDWLATEFTGTGWDIKQMQRLIVSSATYRQTSEATPAEYRADPDNRLLARGPRFRLPAETIRDNALAIGGLLTRRIGGPSIKPYQPEGLWEELAGGAKEPPYVMESGDNLYRRSLYIYRKRTVPHPAMTTFDATSREVCTVSRGRTNTPLQALALLNDPTYVEAARQLAVRSLEHATDPVGRLRFAFRCATCRPPGDKEIQVLTNSFEKYSRRFAESPDQAAEYLAVGQSPLQTNHDPVEVAAYAAVCSVILNLDEVITRE